MTNSVEGDPSPASGAPSGATPGSEAVEVPLPQDLTAPRVARGAVRGLLDRWRLQSVLEPVLLAVSELVTNALRHGRPPVGLRLVRRGRSVVVDVHDASKDLPGAGTSAAEGAESGRGMGIVEALAAEAGTKRLPSDGKVVWARFEAEGGEEGSR